MLRLIIIVFLIYGIGTGLRDGWIVVKWSQFLNEMGITASDPDKPLNWSNFIFDRSLKDSSK